MTHKEMRPAPLGGADAGLGKLISSAAIGPWDTSLHPNIQLSRGAKVLARRFGLQIATAKAIASANAWGASL